MTAHDDMGTPVPLPDRVARVVSLVPSLTESVAHTRPDLLVGATDWCTHTARLEPARVRGTKNPDRQAVLDLRPDLVLANKEENRELDVRRLREAGVAVWVTVTEDVPQAVASLERLFTVALGSPVPRWLASVRELWCGPLPEPVATVAVPVWRDPWMVVGSSTFTGDLLARAGLHNVFATSGDRYPHVDLGEVDRADVSVVLLPDEPYVFGPDDGPEAFSRARTALVSGRLLTWYGPSLLDAHGYLHELAGRLAPNRDGPADHR
jgi:ABC-type Fe3+-hydroxamate transport system substrate-binding protein